MSRGNKNRGNTNKRLFVVIVAIVVCFAVACPARADWQEQDKLTALDGISGDIFGCSVSLSEDYAIVGAYWDDGYSGSSYIFKREGSNWTQQAKLTASDANLGDEFGFAVSVSGNYAIVGAAGDDDKGSRAGSAYVFYFNGTNWTQQAKLTASDGDSEDWFGESVSISADYAILGAPYADGNEPGSGAAYIFKRSGTSWIEQAKLTASDGASADQFGVGDKGGSVSISADYAIVGACGDDDNGQNSGSAYIFEKPGGGWVNATETAKLTASDASADDRFGNSVSISGDYAIVAAYQNDDNGTNSGSAYIFRRDVTTWTHQANLTASDGAADDEFGRSVSISGNYAIVGAWFADTNGLESGAAYIFKRSGTSWAEDAMLTASDGATWDTFGSAVSIGADYAIVGAPGDEMATGSAYVFSYEDGEPTGVVEEWVARYNGPAGSWDRARALALDAAGNVYVTGDSVASGFWDYGTVKYDPNGNELWAAHYDGPGGGGDIDWCYAVAVDSSGNVYVTGESWGGPETGSDYATVKYDPSGNELWVARYDGPASRNELAYALAVDALGNVYVTGYSSGNGTDFDYATIKYDPNGDELWVARYDGPASDHDIAYALAVDASGNVYVTGRSEGLTTGDDYATIKYGPGGTEEWVARYNGPGSSFDHAYALAVDGSGNVYVTGRSIGSGTRQDYATIKYGPDGTQQWVARYDGPASGIDEAHALAVDGSGNVYVTGESIGGSGTHWDYATIKYAPDSNEPLWVARYDGPGSDDDRAEALALDDLGNVYVTGSSYGGSGTHSNYTTVKYGPDGSQQWEVHYDGPATEGVHDYDSAYDIAVDGSGNVYVTGTSADTEDDCVTIKYSPGVCPYSLTVTKIPGGTTDPNVGTHTYPCHSFVQVTAVPDINYRFDHWELDGNDVGSANPYSVLMDDEHTLHAVFVHDTDGDGIPDNVDNCPDVYNTDQTDSDEDGIGDECECDAANIDGVVPVNFKDFAIPANNWLMSGPGLAGDTNRDWSVDPCDLAQVAQHWLVVCPCIDKDGDGYGVTANPRCLFPELDCEDTDPNVNPGAEEICDDSIDNDCDGLADNADPDCAIWPECWNCPTQCYGDADCAPQGPYQVSTNDVAIMQAAWMTSYPDNLYNPCADFDRDGMVGVDDLVILQIWLNQIPGPAADCEAGGVWPPVP